MDLMRGSQASDVDRRGLCLAVLKDTVVDDLLQRRFIEHGGMLVLQLWLKEAESDLEYVRPFVCLARLGIPCTSF